MRRRSARALKVKWNPARKLYEPVLLERHVVKEIVDRLWMQARIKVWVINQPVGGKTPQNEAGIPDLSGFVPTVITHQPAIPLYIEVKRPGGKRSEAQKRFILEAKQGGCIAFFAECWLDVVREMAMFNIQLAV